MFSVPNEHFNHNTKYLPTMTDIFSVMQNGTGRISRPISKWLCNGYFPLAAQIRLWSCPHPHTLIRGRVAGAAAQAVVPRLPFPGPY